MANWYNLLYQSKSRDLKPILQIWLLKHIWSQTAERRLPDMTGSHHPNKTIYRLINRSSRVSNLTCSWSQQPAVQVTSSHGEVKHQSPLAVDSVQDVLHRHWGVGVWVLLACLPLHQEVGKGSRATPLRYCQGLVVVTCEVQTTMLINASILKPNNSFT